MARRKSIGFIASTMSDEEIFKMLNLKSVGKKEQRKRLIGLAKSYSKYRAKKRRR